MESRERLEILHILAPAPFGGLESVVLALAEGQSRRGSRVGVLSLLDPEPAPDPLAADLTRAGIEAIPLRVPPRAYRLERRQLAELLRRLGPGLVHTHGYRPDLQAGAVARAAGIPQVATVHGFTGGGIRMRINEWLQRRALARADAVVAVSNPMAQRLGEAGVPKDRLHVISNAWSGGTGLLPCTEARAKLGVDPRHFVIGWVGRLSREKGADVLLSALAELGDPSLFACIVGDGEERGVLKEQAAGLELTERIVWAGAQPDAGRLFAAFDVFVLSSRTEGTPIVLFEAMSAGIPIVASSVGGVPDVLEDDAGWLVPSENPAGIARALRELREHPAEAIRRASNARSQLETRYALDPWLTAYDGVYGDVLSANPRLVSP